MRALLLIICSFWMPVDALAQPPEKPRLVLQITVDQLRGDLPERYYERLGEGGFRYLLEKGTVYKDAHHAHANTETIVGHATLATGAHPAVHGMVGNVWFDRAIGRTVYNIEDGRYRLLTEGADVDRKTEIDPTQKAARSEGRSPAAILTSTFSDELALHTGGKAKVFAVSVKDRGAVSMAGHAGKAFWFSKASGTFVTSSYYYKTYPDWVSRFNAKKPAAAWSGKKWDLLEERSTYLFGDDDDRPFEIDLAGFGRVFPHAFRKADGKYYTTLLTISPAGDELTTKFAKSIIEFEGLGQDAVPDYLGVSYSSTDYIGHIFGPSSLEAEDNLLRLDRQLADLFAYVDDRVGLDKTLIVLSADHGGPRAPGLLKRYGIDAAYVTPDTWDRTPAIAALKQKFGVGKKLIKAYDHPYVYLDRDVLAEKGLDGDAVARVVAREIEKFPHVHQAVASADLRTGAFPDTPVKRAILNNYHPKRSGDIYLVFDAQCFINDFDGLLVACTHGMPWSYDTYVPIIFAGPGIPARRVHRRVHTVDVAHTLALFLGTCPPSGSSGRALVEVFGEGR